MLGSDVPGRADHLLRTVFHALRAGMTGEEVKTVGRCLPPEYHADWDEATGYPSDIFEKEEMMFEPEVKR